jgi:glycosyltransferase involved in cell wall biosynthesis
MPASHGAPRVLLIIQHLAFGGAELQLTHLAKGLAELGHEVTLCCIDDADPALERPVREAGVEVVKLHAPSRVRRALAVPRLARLARQADAVHCTMWDATLWGRLAAILARRPVIVADHTAERSVQLSLNGKPRGSWIGLHYRLLDRFTSATIACADAQRAVLTRDGVALERIVHIPNGVPIDGLVQAAEGSGVTRADLGIPDDAKLVIQVGVFRAEKNHIGALEALARVREEVPDVHLVFVGDGECREGVEQRARELGADWAHFLGFRADVPALLALSDVLVLPSAADAMPMTVIEALALEVPVIATDVGDVARTLAGGAGVVVPADDADALVRACRDLLADPGRRAELARSSSTPRSWRGATRT